jgi:RNA polymerase sigma factor (sigma-70 family)
VTARRPPIEKWSVVLRLRPGSQLASWPGVTYTLQFKHGEPDEHVRRLVDESVGKLERLVEEFPPDAVTLRVVVQNHTDDPRSQVSATLTVPGRVLAAHEERHRSDEAVRDAFVELQRQLEKYKAKARHSDVYKRPARREEVRRQKLEAIPAEERRMALLSALVEDHLPALYNFVRREIAYHVAMDDLRADELTPDDVVAAVVVRAQREFVKKPESRDIRGWLIQLTLDELEREVMRTKANGAPAARIEEDIPETLPQQEVSTLGDEILDFHQPDEDLKLEDAIPARTPTPEEILENHELQNYIARTLAHLPRAYRRAFVLRYVEDFSVAEIARILGTTAQQVEHDLARAQDSLRHRLMKAGLALQTHDMERMFGTAADVEVPDAVRRAVDDKLTRPEEAGAHRAGES